MQEVNEAVADISASAKAGLEKTMAVVEEKIEKMMTDDPVRIKAAEEKKHSRINEAERIRQEAMAQNQAANRGTPPNPTTHNVSTGATSEAAGSKVTADTNTPDGPTGDPKV